MSDDEDLLADAGGGEFPSADVVEFGFDEENKKLTGRRKKLQKKAKPGSFGERRRAAAGSGDSPRAGLCEARLIVSLPRLPRCRRNHEPERAGAEGHQAQGLPPADAHTAQDAAAHPAGACRRPAPALRPALTA